MEDLWHIRYPRRFVDFQPEAMTCAMKETLHSIILGARLVTSAIKNLFYSRMDFLAVDPSPNLRKCHFLSFENSIVHSPKTIDNWALYHSAGDVCKVSGLVRFREEVKNNRFTRAQWPVAAVVGVAGLDASGYYGMLSGAVSFE